MRNKIYNESGSVSTIGISETDAAWAKEVKVRRKMFFLIEGLSIYWISEENPKMLFIIRNNFENAIVLMDH